MTSFTDPSLRLTWCGRGPSPTPPDRRRRTTAGAASSRRRGVPLAPAPGQLAEHRLAVHQIRTDGGDPLRQTLHELHVGGGQKLEVRHVRHCVRTRQSRRTVFRARRSRQPSAHAPGASSYGGPRSAAGTNAGVADSIRIAVAQSPVSCDPLVNGAAVRNLMVAAREAGARLVHFPEGAISGYPAGAAAKQALSGWAIDWASLQGQLECTARLAADLGIWVVAGSNHRLTPPNRPQTACT